MSAPSKTHRNLTSVSSKSRNPNGMMSSDAVTPWVSNTFFIVPESAVPKMGTTRGSEKVWSKEANSVELIPAELVTRSRVSSMGRGFFTVERLLGRRVSLGRDRTSERDAELIEDQFGYGERERKTYSTRLLTSVSSYINISSRYR